MALLQTLRIYEAVDNAFTSGEAVKELFKPYPLADVSVQRVHGEKGFTDFIRILIPGTEGKRGADKRRASASLAGWAAWAPGRSASGSSPMATARLRRCPPH